MKPCKYCGSELGHLIVDGGCEFDESIRKSVKVPMMNMLDKMDKQQALFLLKHITKIIEKYRL